MNLLLLNDALNRFSEMLCEYKKIDRIAPPLQDAVRESLLQRFEYTQEIAWKTAKRYLVTREGFQSDMGPKTVFRKCGELALLDPERWIEYLEARQAIAHDYSGEKAPDVLSVMDDFLTDAAALYHALEVKLAEAK